MGVGGGLGEWGEVWNARDLLPNFLCFLCVRNPFPPEAVKDSGRGKRRGTGAWLQWL